MAPVLVASGGALRLGGDLVYQFFHPICHQVEDRSFHILGEPLAVCIRCSSIYFAFLGGVLLYPLGVRIGRYIASHRSVLLWSVLPMCIDVVLDELGVFESTSSSRIGSGMLFGVIIPFYIIPAVQEAVQEFAAGSWFLTPSAIKKGQTHA